MIKYNKESKSFSLMPMSELDWRMSGTHLLKFTDRELDGYLDIQYKDKKLIIQEVKQTRYDYQKGAKTGNSEVKVNDAFDVIQALSNITIGGKDYQIPKKLIKEFISRNSIK